MNYVYDILSNFNQELYDFYDWDKNDNFTHLRKVPSFRVSKEVLVDLMFKKVKIKGNLLKLIKDKTQVFTKEGVDVIEYGFIVSDSVNSLGVILDEDGVVYKRSKFLVSEELEINKCLKTSKIYNVEYNLLSSKTHYSNMTRNEEKVTNLILNELELIMDSTDKIDYLYYEWFNTNKGKNKYKKLVSSIKSSYTSKHEYILELLNLLKIKK
ncbi:putative uncharacterized protein [Clostridium sp. CAG:628]|nr:putative uncharacterized protein [Clostridium sp. CAG:628]